MSNDQSRFAAVTRRAFLERSALLGLAGVLAACGANADSDVFAGSGTTADASDGATTAADGASTTAAMSDATPAAATTQASTATATAAPAPVGDPLPDAAELQIAFTFAAASAGGRPAKNPYIAVWIEDPSGRMVRTVSLWLQSGKGQKWWSDLPRWYRQDTARVAAGGPSTADTITGATRTAGDYTVSWDGNGYDGARLAQGTYFVCIEAAREHGPYELIRESVTLGAAAVQQALTPKNELTSASVSYVV